MCISGPMKRGVGTSTADRYLPFGHACKRSKACEVRFRWTERRGLIDFIIPSSRPPIPFISCNPETHPQWPTFELQVIMGQSMENQRPTDKA